jgi:hypothetical protein
MSQSKSTDGDKLSVALKRLQDCSAKIVQTQGYTREVKSLKILEEMIREQITNAHPRPSTRTIR